MPRKPKNPGEGKNTTERKVQSQADKPFALPPGAKPAPEVDDDPWGEDKLTHKQRLFVAYYVGEAAGNASKAARLAGYRDDNADSLKATAWETLTKPYVQRAIARKMAERFGSLDDVRFGVAEIANANAADFMSADDQGRLKLDLDKMAAAGALGLIKGVDEEIFEVEGTPGRVVKRKFKFHDRLKALEILARMNGQLIDRTRHEGEVKFNPITLEGDREAAPDADPPDSPPRAGSEEGGEGAGA